MTEAQTNMDLDQFLNDSDCDIQDDYSSVVDSAYIMRKKFSSILRQARQLKTKLLEERALTARHQRQSSHFVKTGEMARNKLRKLSNKLQQSKAENNSLRIRIQELAGDLQAAREELEAVDHLRCDICRDRFKNVLIISCGHSFCRGCLTLWLDGPNKGCPTCRQSFEERDIQDIYLGAGSQTPDVPDGDDDVTDVISLASDSE